MWAKAWCGAGVGVVTVYADAGCTYPVGNYTNPVPLTCTGGAGGYSTFATCSGGGATATPPAGSPSPVGIPGTPTASESASASPALTPSASSIPGSWQANGNAVYLSTPGHLPVAVTPSAQQNGGSVFYTRATDVSTSFTWDSVVVIDELGGLGPGADSIELTLSTDPAGAGSLWSQFCCKGFISPAVALVLRTYNLETSNMTLYGHTTVELWYGLGTGSYAVSRQVSPTNLKSGNPLLVNVTYSGSPDHALVAVITENVTGGLTTTYSWTYDVAAALNCSAYPAPCVAFFGANANTYNGWERHRLMSMAMTSSGSADRGAPAASGAGVATGGAPALAIGLGVAVAFVAAAVVGALIVYALRARDHHYSSSVSSAPRSEPTKAPRSTVARVFARKPSTFAVGNPLRAAGAAV